MRKFRKIREHKWIGGVCAGVGYTLGIPTWLVRLIWVLLACAFGFGVGLYILLWIFMPAWEEAPGDYAERAGG